MTLSGASFCKTNIKVLERNLNILLKPLMVVIGLREE